MKNRISPVNVGNATSIFLAITFIFCVVFDLIFPEHAMYRAWQDLLPGFEWISWKSFLIGLIETYVYGWYFAVIWVPLYNCFSNRTNEPT
jgi:cytochrome c biogenesis protein CcdA